MIELSSKNKLDKKIVVIMTASVLYGWYAVANITHMNTLAGLIMLAVLATLPADKDIYVYAALIPFLKLIPHGSPIRVYFFLVLSIVKILLQKGTTISKRSALFLTIWLGIAVGLDIVYAPAFDLSLFTMMVYFALYLSLCRVTSAEIGEIAAFLLVFSFTVALCSTILSSETSLTYYLASQNAEARFGEDARSLGGAMDMPIYCALTIAIVIERFVTKNLRLLEKIGYIVLACGSILFGLITVSRSFLLGIGTIVCWTYLSLLNEKKYHISLFRITVVFLLVIAFLFYKQSDAISNIVIKYSQRDFLKSSRSMIYEDCIDYLLLHPLNFLIGTGALGYHALGIRENLNFQMFAHNLVLDAVMSWGIIGTFAMGEMIHLYCKGMKKNNKNPQLIRFLPLVTWGIFMMVGGTFNYLEQYLYIIILLKLSYCFSEKKACDKYNE